MGAVEDDLVVSEGLKPSVETVVALEAMVGCASFFRRIAIGFPGINKLAAVGWKVRTVPKA